MARLNQFILAIALLASVGAAQAGATTAEFEFIDSNHDSRISSGEHEVYARLLFDELDNDPDDDKLTVAEIMANPDKFFRHVFTSGNILGPAELTPLEKIQRLDANQDGVISQTEHANGAATRFQKLDINNNGEVSAEEFEAGG